MDTTAKFGIFCPNYAIDVFLRWLKTVAQNCNVNYKEWYARHNCTFEELIVEEEGNYFGLSRPECSPKEILKALCHVKVDVPKKFDFRSLLEHLDCLNMPNPISKQARKWFENYANYSDYDVKTLELLLSEVDEEMKQAKEKKKGKKDKRSKKKKKDIVEREERPACPSDESLSVLVEKDKSGWIKTLQEMVRAERSFCGVCCEAARRDAILDRQTKAEKGMTDVSNVLYSIHARLAQLTSLLLIRYEVARRHLKGD